MDHEYAYLSLAQVSLESMEIWKKKSDANEYARK